MGMPSSFFLEALMGLMWIVAPLLLFGLFIVGVLGYAYINKKFGEKED